MHHKESVFNAIKGSSVVFGVTNCEHDHHISPKDRSDYPTVWEKMDGDVETAQGKLLADACKEANVERFIFSSLPYVSKGNDHSFNLIYHFLIIPCTGGPSFLARALTRFSDPYH
jgi:NmrA-like family